MPIDLNQLGVKCRRLRVEILLITLDEAAQRTGIEASRLNAIEDVTVEPSCDDVILRADAYSEPVEYFITSERLASSEKASDLYRMYGETFSSTQRCVTAASLGRWLEWTRTNISGMREVFCVLRGLDYSLDMIAIPSERPLSLKKD